MPEHFSQSIEGLEPAQPVAPGRDRRRRHVRPDGLARPQADRRGRAAHAGLQRVDPGPVLRVRQGSAITVRFENRLELDTTVHWHGLRHDYLYDGVPRAGSHGGMQDPVKPGEGVHLPPALSRPRRLLVPPAHARGLHAGDGAHRATSSSSRPNPATGRPSTAISSSCSTTSCSRTASWHPSCARAPRTPPWVATAT